MSTPAAKRRRIDLASSTLSKPFRSPFKTPFIPPVKTDASKLDTTALKSSTDTFSSTDVEPTLASAVLVSSPLPKTPIHASPRRKTPIGTLPSPRSTASLNSDPDIASLLRAQRELEKQLREVKEQLETAEQARKIESESLKKDLSGEVDGDLAELITKWRSASRQAAEELFGQVRDRVNRMGGPRAWKEMQKRQQEFQNSWDQEQADDSDANEEDDSEKRDAYLEYDVEVETENEKAQRMNGHGDTGELTGQEDEFTMAMMLKTLNVGLNVIGYENEQQRWAD